jgi:vacuolar-type H+-ATPase subunit E/Vma4
MSLAAIIEAIRSAGETQISEIESEAYTKARLILAEAREKARDLQEQTCASILIPAYHDRARIIQKGRMEALRITGEAREELIDTTLSQARGRLAIFRNNLAYARVLKKLVHQALTELQASLGQTAIFVIQADLRDQDILEKILSGTGLDLNVKYDLTCWGGVIIKSVDDSVVVINTLEARFERAIPYLRRCLAIQFESQDFVKVDMAVGHG